jgi:hypothetical protein
MSRENELHVKELTECISPANTGAISAELSVTLDCWREQVPPVYCGVLSDFSRACHRHGIFNMLNNFSHE